nr:MOSC domain-containing protein [uncultured Actinoplanes sp.]
MTGKVLSVNVGVPRPNPAKGTRMTGIDKHPVDHAVEVRPPGPKRTGLHSGLVGDPIGDVKHHGGDDQAVYAYAREDLDWWENELGRELPGGMFGENLTTYGVEVSGAVIGEVWRIGDVVELQTTFGRIPCATFQARMALPRWVKRFTAANRTGTYFRILKAGHLRGGDPIEILHRPAHGVTVDEAFRIYMNEPESLPRLLEADELPEDLRRKVTATIARTPR